MKVLYEEDRKAAFMNIVALIHLLCRFIFLNPNIILVKKVAAYKTQAKIYVSAPAGRRSSSCLFHFAKTASSHRRSFPSVWKGKRGQFITQIKNILKIRSIYNKILKGIINKSYQRSFPRVWKGKGR